MLGGSNGTRIGHVRHVLGATITVELDSSLAGVSPIWEGRLQSVGQVGNLVRIPQGPITLLAAVSLVGISELSTPLEPSGLIERGDRWLRAELLGEVDGLGEFHRGVSQYPGLDADVHFVTGEELRSVYPEPDTSHVRVGALASNPDIPVAIEARSLVTRHSAVVGSTGSGKTSAVVTILQSFIRGGWRNANIVVIDPHGEYAAALTENASLKSVTGEGAEELSVPFWALPADDVLRAFLGSEPSATLQSRFSELVANERRNQAADSDWLDLEPEEIGADTPIPFDLRQVWYQLDYENRQTHEDSRGVGKVMVEDAGDADQLRSATFTPHGPGGGAPFQGHLFNHYGTGPDRIRLKLADEQFAFFRRPAGIDVESDPLPAILDSWLGGNRPISVLDFSGVPGEVADLAIGVVLQLIFEVAARSIDDGIGRPRPVLVVLEEAHRYLNEGIVSVRLARAMTNRIAREGRKYGVGLMLVTQRPSELPQTALAQAGTIATLRLTNAADQGVVRAALPDAISGLADHLASLRTGEAVISGEAIALPTRVLIDLPDPGPAAADPGLESWRAAPTKNSVHSPLARWRKGR